MKFSSLLVLSVLFSTHSFAVGFDKLPRIISLSKTAALKLGIQSDDIQSIEFDKQISCLRANELSPEPATCTNVVKLKTSTIVLNQSCSRDLTVYITETIRTGELKLVDYESSTCN